jgi:hypothetical protein
VSVLSHLRGHVVTNDRVQASHEHQTIIQLEFAIKSKGGIKRIPLVEKGVNPSLVSLQTLHQVGTEAVHAIRENAHAVKQVGDHHGLEDVKLELAVHATDGGSDVITHNLGADHGEGLALGGVDLSGHNRRAGLVLGQAQLAQAAARAGTQVAHILGNLEEGGGQGVEGAGGLDNRIVGSQNLELVGGGLELGAGQLGDLSSDGLVEALEGVETSADSGTTLSQVAQVGKSGLDTLDVTVELGDVARELLAKSKGSGVLQVGAADLDNVLELVDLHLEGVAEGLERRQKRLLDLDNGSDVHDGGEGVIGGGGHVNVVVGVDGLLGAHGATEDLNSTVGDNLVGVHVGLGAGTGLPDDQREVVQQLTLSDLSGGLLDSLTNLGVLRKSINWQHLIPTRVSHTKAILHVHFSSSTLQDTEGLDHRGRHAILRLVDVEVAQGAVSISDLVLLPIVTYRFNGGVLPLGLRTPVLVSRDLLRKTLARCGTIAAALFTHLDFTKGIALSTSVNRLETTNQFVWNCLSTALRNCIPF